jgi:hypothetical protein
VNFAPSASVALNSWTASDALGGFGFVQDPHLIHPEPLRSPTTEHLDLGQDFWECKSGELPVAENVCGMKDGVATLKAPSGFPPVLHPAPIFLVSGATGAC